MPARWIEMQVDFSRWAVVAHKDDSGFGRMADDIRRVLGIGRHLVVPSERLRDKPVDGVSERMLYPDAPDNDVRELVAGLQGIIFFERHNWHKRLLPLCRLESVKTVCVPMWEWFNGSDREWDDCDFFLAPSRFSLEAVLSSGRKNAMYLTWPLDLSRFPARCVQGPARLFIHNGGLIDADDRKATADTIRAFLRVRREDIRLMVRLQQDFPLPKADSRVEVRVGNLDDPASLYRQGDVAIQPSKMEGFGFMVIEPLASGLPVITLDYGPMNEFVRQKSMLVKKRPFARRAYATTWFKKAHLRIPDQVDLAARITWCAENDLAEISAGNRAFAEALFARERLVCQWSTVLQALIDGREPAGCLAESQRLDMA